MKATHLKLYVYEHQKQLGEPLYDWLIVKAKEYSVFNAIVYKGIAGFGKDKKIHEETFFELGADLPLKISLVIEIESAKKFVEMIKKENIDLFYTSKEIECDYT